MKLIAFYLLSLLLSITFISALKQSEAFSPLRIIRTINAAQKVQQSGWYAGPNALFMNKSWNQVKSLFISEVEFQSIKQKMVAAEPVNHNEELKAQVPESYSVDLQYPKCKIGIMTQGNCGSSWAIPAVNMAQSRACVSLTKKNESIETSSLSLQYVVSCDSDSNCCNGGSIDSALNFLADQGTVTEHCFPYNSTGGLCQECPTKCVDGSPLKHVKPIDAKTIRNFANVESAKVDLVEYGYISTYIKVYSDFLFYKGGIYRHSTGSAIGYHGIRVIGFGVDTKKQPYWILANSFGTEWGMNGYMQIAMGMNECDIESSMVAATSTF